MPFAAPIEELFSRAGLRLLRRARAQGVAPDIAEDLVQETLLEAWRSLEHLRDEARFTAWLDGIYHNVRLRYQRKQGIVRLHETQPNADEPDAEPFFEQLADSQSFDPTEELARQDMAALLDRTLGYLPPTTRAIVQQHYLAEVPQRELAAQLGLTLSALEARLHRARAEMLRVLSTDLRADALSFGLALDPADASDWRVTRLRCIFCGHGIWEGRFLPMANGRIDLQLRCPACNNRTLSSLGLVELGNARSFLPALKKTMNAVSNYFIEAMAAGGVNRCLACGQPDHIHVMRKDLPDIPIGMQSWVVSQCGCSEFPVHSLAALMFGAHPQVRAFLFGSDRVVIQPEVEVRYDGQPAIRSSFLSLSTGRQIHTYADPTTLAPLAVIEE